MVSRCLSSAIWVDGLPFEWNGVTRCALRALSGGVVDAAVRGVESIAIGNSSSRAVARLITFLSLADRLDANQDGYLTDNEGPLGPPPG